MEGRNFKKIGRGENSLVFESKNQSQKEGIVLKFHFHELSDIVDMILQKKNPDLYSNSKRFLVIRKMLEEKDLLILERLNEIEDLNIQKEVENYCLSNDNSKLDMVMSLLQEYFSSRGEYIFVKYKKDIENIRNGYERITEFFGKDNVLKINVFKVNSENIEKIDEYESIKLLNEIRTLLKKDLLNSDDWNKIKEFIKKNNIELPIIIQEKFTTSKKTTIEFCSPIPIYIEFEKILHEDQLTGDYKNTKKELDHCLLENKLCNIADMDDDTKNSVSGFVKKTIKYTKETKKFIDFFGPDNVLFYKEKGVSKYKLLDPFINMSMYYTNTEMKNDSLKNFLEKNKYEIRHFYVYLKTLNKFAEKLGLEERLTPEDIFGTRIQGVEKEINEFIK